MTYRRIMDLTGGVGELRFIGDGIDESEYTDESTEIDIDEIVSKGNGDLDVDLEKEFELLEQYEEIDV